MGSPHLPPLSWFRSLSPKNQNRPVRELLGDYYAQHPEHLPPPGWYADFCAREAGQGNPGPLIGLVQSGRPLSPAAIKFIVKALEAKRSRRGNEELREREKQLIALEVDGLIDEELKTAPSRRGSQKRAIADVIKHRGRSESTIRTALAKYGKRRRSRS